MCGGSRSLSGTDGEGERSKNSPGRSATTDEVGTKDSSGNEIVRHVNADASFVRGGGQLKTSSGFNIQ